MTLDPEKIPDAPCREIDYAGVRLPSRYGKRRDLEAMMAAVDWIADHALPVLEKTIRVFCGTKACASYTVTARATGADLEAIAAAFDFAFRAVDGGRNGILVEGLGDATADRDPWWPECEDDLWGE